MRKQKDNELNDGGANGPKRHWETLTFDTWDARHSSILLIRNQYSVISFISANILNQPALITDTGQGLFCYPGTPNNHLITLIDFTLNRDSGLIILY